MRIGTASFGPRTALAAGGGVLAAAIGALLFGACSTPSATVDGGDLLGVFDRADAAPDAARGDAGRRDARAQDGGAKPGKKAEIAPGPVRTRAPAEGACVSEQGAANKELRRTLGRPACRDAMVLESRDAEGSPRYACVFAPKGMEARKPLPLVLFFHGSEDDPTSFDKKTGLRKLAARADLTGDPAHAGFVVLAPQGRAIKNGKLGSIFDVEHVSVDNLDAATLEGFVSELVAKGWIDRRRVYALGNGSGGTMAAAYAMLRADRVAAFASFASEPPEAQWACAGSPPPGMVLYRACDAVVSCEGVERWLRDRDALRAETRSLRLGAADETEPNCTVRNRCTKVKGDAHHRRWPKGREADILRFFASHALALPQPSAPDGGPH